MNDIHQWPLALVHSGLWTCIFIYWRAIMLPYIAFPLTRAPNPLTPSPTHLLTLSPTHPPTLSPTHPPTLSPHHPSTLSPTHPPTLSPTHPPTLSPHHPLTSSPTHPLTYSPTHPLTSSQVLLVQHCSVCQLWYQLCGGLQLAAAPLSDGCLGAHVPLPVPRH